MQKDQPYNPLPQNDGAYAPQGYPPQDYPPVQGYPPPAQGYPPQGYPPQGYAPQPYNTAYGAPPTTAYVVPQPVHVGDHHHHHVHVTTDFIRAKRTRGMTLIILGFIFIAIGVGLSVGLSLASGGTWTVVWYGLPIVGLIEIIIGASNLVQARRLQAQLDAGGHV